MRKFHQSQKPMHQGYNPVHAAVAIKALHEEILNLRVMCSLNVDGDVYLNQLASMAYVLGLGAEVAVHLDKQSPLARSMHGALRSVLQMVQEGGRWREPFAFPISEALLQAQQLCIEWPALALSFNPGAIELSNAIRNNRADLSAIAGAEIYQEEQKERATS